MNTMIGQQDFTMDGLLAQLRELLRQVDSRVASINTRLLGDLLGHAIATKEIEIEYQRLRKYEGIDPIDFIEGAALVGQAEAAKIREARDLHRRLMKRFDGE